MALTMKNKTTEGFDLRVPKKKINNNAITHNRKKKLLRNLPDQ